MNAALGAETGASVGGLLGNAAEAYGTYGKTAGQVMNAAQQGQEMAAASEPPPIQPPPQRQVANLDLSSILSHSQNMQNFEQQEQERRRMLMSQYASNIGRV